MRSNPYVRCHVPDRRARLVVVCAVTAVLAVFGGCGGSGGSPSGTPTVNDVPQAIPDTGNPKGDAGTIAFEITPTWDLGQSGNVPLMNIGSVNWSDPHLIVFANDGYLRVNSVNDAGQENSVGVRIDSWMPGQSHAIAVTWGSGVEVVYLDGTPVGRLEYDHTLELPPGTPIHLGSWIPGVPGAEGQISDFKVLGRALTAEEVAGLSDAGPPVAVETPTASGATLRVVSTAAAAGDGTGNICVELSGGSGLVAGTQNDLTWDPSCVQIGAACQANPQTEKDVFTRAYGPDHLRALVLSYTSTAPITDGVLYCCPFQVASSAAAGCCAVALQGVAASDSYGNRVIIDAVDGQICKP